MIADTLLEMHEIERGKWKPTSLSRNSKRKFFIEMHYWRGVGSWQGWLRSSGSWAAATPAFHTTLSDRKSYWGAGISNASSQNAVQSLIRLVMLMKKKESIFTLLTLNHGDPPRNEFLITSPFLQWILIIYSSFMHSWVWIFLFRQHLMCFQGAHLNDSSFFKAFSPALVCSTFTFCCFSVKSLKLAPSASSLLDHLSIKCFASAYLQFYAFSSFPELLPAVLRL